MQSPPKEITAHSKGRDKRFAAKEQPLVTSKKQTAAVLSVSFTLRERMISEIPENRQTKPQTESKPEELETTLSTTAFENGMSREVIVSNSLFSQGINEAIKATSKEAAIPEVKMILPASLEPSIAFPTAFTAKPAPELTQKRISFLACVRVSFPADSMEAAAFAPTG